MRFVVVGPHLKVMSKAVRLMAKYTEYVNLLGTHDGLLFQAVNDSKSSFIEVKFDTDFFIELTGRHDFECKVDIKSLLLVFSIVHLDRIVDRCRISMGSALPKISVEMKCKNYVSRKYFIPYMENDVIRCPLVSGRMSKASLKSSAKMLFEMFRHFSTSTKEASIWMFDNNIRFKTFIESDDQNFFDLPSTSFWYLASDFSAYNYDRPLAVTCNVKDIKAFIEFATHQNQQISIYIQANTLPIEFSFTSQYDSYSARIVLATFEFADSQQPRAPAFNPSTSTRPTVQSSQTTNASLNESLNYSTTQTTIWGENANSENTYSNENENVAENNMDTSQQQHHHSNVASLDQRNDVNMNTAEPREERPSSSSSTTFTLGQDTDDSLFVSRPPQKDNNIQQQQEDREEDFQSGFPDIAEENNINIQNIIENLPDYTEQEESSQEYIQLSGDQLSDFQRRYIMGLCDNDESQDALSEVSHFVSDSEGEED